MVLGQMKMHLKYPLPIPVGATFSCIFFSVSNLCLGILKFVHLYSWVWLDRTKDRLIKVWAIFKKQTFVALEHWLETELTKHLDMAIGHDRETPEILWHSQEICLISWYCFLASKKFEKWEKMNNFFGNKPKVKHFHFLP